MYLKGGDEMVCIRSCIENSMEAQEWNRGSVEWTRGSVYGLIAQDILLPKYGAPLKPLYIIDGPTYLRSHRSIPCAMYVTLCNIFLTYFFMLDIYTCHHLVGRDGITESGFYEVGIPGHRYKVYCNLFLGVGK